MKNRYLIIILFIPILLSCNIDKKNDNKVNVNIDSIYINKISGAPISPNKKNFIKLFFKSNSNLKIGEYKIIPNNYDYYFQKMTLYSTSNKNVFEMKFILSGLEVYPLSLNMISKKYDSIFKSKDFGMVKEKDTMKLNFLKLRNEKDVYFFIDGNAVDGSDSLSMNKIYRYTPKRIKYIPS